MTRHDRIRAFSMRCDGLTWDQIGAALHYDGQTVAKSLHTVLKRRHPSFRIRSAALRTYVQRQCEGSVNVFAGQLGVSPYRLRRVLIHGDEPALSLRRKVLAATGLTAREAFGERGDGPCEG